MSLPVLSWTRASLRGALRGFGAAVDIFLAVEVEKTRRNMERS